MNNHSNLAIIILNWNNFTETKRCLDSYFSTEHEKADVILVDNASTDGSGQELSEKFHQVIYLASDKNLGYSGGNNLGLHYAVENGYSYTLILNNDTDVIDIKFIDKLADFLVENPEVGAVSPAVLTKEGDLQDTILYFPFVSNLVRGFLGLNTHDLHKKQEVESISGCCVLLRSLAVQQVGYIDENYFLYGEETEWFYRMRLDHWQIFYLPEPSIIHYGASSTKRLPRLDVYLEKRSNIIYTLVKHGFRFQAGVILLATFLVLIFRIIKNKIIKGKDQQPGFNFLAVPEFFRTMNKKWLLANQPG